MNTMACRAKAGFSLQKVAMVAFFAMFGALYAVPSQATITSYELMGHLGEGQVYWGGSDDEVIDSGFEVTNPLLQGVAFSLKFDLNDSVAGVSVGAADFTFAEAVSNLELMVGGASFWKAEKSDVTESEEAGAQQWYIAETTGVHDAGEYVDLVDSSDSSIVDELKIGSFELILVDLDGALFGSSPFELAAFDGSEFELAEIQLKWLGFDYDYKISGGIESVVVSAVPVPSALLFFATSLVGFLGIARKKS